MATECGALKWLAAQCEPVRGEYMGAWHVAQWSAARAKDGRCFEDKEGWQYTPRWIETNIKWLHELAHKLTQAVPRYEHDELLSVLVEQVYDLARTVRPVSKSGKPVGKMLTYVGSYARHFAMESLRFYGPGLVAPRGESVAVAHFGDVRERNNGDLLCEPAAAVPVAQQGELDFARWAREMAHRCPRARERLVELARMLPDSEERQAVELVCGDGCGLLAASATMHRTRRKVARLLASGLGTLAVLMRSKGLKPPVVRPAVQLTIEGA